MRSLSCTWAGVVALAFAVGCGSSVDQLFDGEAGGAGGSGADGGGSTESSTGTPSGTGAAGATGSGTGATSGSVGSSGSGATSVGSGGSGASGPGATSSVATTSSGMTSGVGGSGSCSHDVCEVGAPLDPMCTDCTVKICQQDPSCCQNFWHDGCVFMASEQCGCFVEPGCASCSDFLNGATNEPLCPGSEQLVEELYNCACNFGCPMECSDACAGGGTSAECQNCVVSSCSFEFQNCLNDF